MKPTIPPDIEQEFLRLPAAARFSGLSTATLERLIRVGDLKSTSPEQSAASA